MSKMEKLMALLAEEMGGGVSIDEVVGVLEAGFAKIIEDVKALSDDVEAEEPEAKRPAKPAKEEKVAAKRPAKPAKEEKTAKDKAPAKRPAKGKAKEVELPEDFPYEISDVTDEEVKESEYMELTETELKTEFEEREIPLPEGFGKSDMIKTLILDDEWAEDDE